MLQENKARQIFRKRSISYPQEIFVVWKILLALFSCNNRFENLTFALLPFALGQLNSRVLRKKNYSWGIVNLWRKWFILLLIFVDILHEKLGTNDIFQLSLSAPTRQNGLTHSNNPSASAEELIECVWLFCGVGA